MTKFANVKEVNSCLICGNFDLVPIIDLGEHAISSRFPKSSEPDPPLAPLQLVKCNNLNKEACGLLQLKHIVPGEEMYTNQYGYRSGLNATMTNHLNALAKEIMSKINLEKGDVILDIGSNDATLLKAFNINGLNKIGIDPTGNQFMQFYEENTNLIVDYFSFENFAKASPDKKAKVITSIAMFYDLPDPMKFVQDIKQCLDENGIWISEQSYMPSMLKRNSFDTICHEHLEYYSLKQIDWMAKRNGLRILDATFNEINGGSFRFYVSHANSNLSINEQAISNILNEEKELGLDKLKPFEEFQKRVEKIKFKLSSFLKERKSSGKKIHIYGASTKGNTLLQYFGIGSDIIDAAAERNPEKFGRVTPKTRIPMIPEEQSRKENPDYFLVLPWHFKDEFIEREKSYLESGGKFIFPLPEFQIVGKEGLEYGEQPEQ